MPIIHLVRHGEVYNPQGILYGRLPGFRLSARGQAMAERLGEYFAQQQAEGHQLAYLAASPLLRAQQTAAPIAAALGLECQVDEDLVEAENRFQGLKITPKELLKPHNLRYCLDPLTPSWGEPYREQAERMARAINRARAQSYERAGEQDEAVLVSHQLPIWLSRLVAERRGLPHDPRRRECSVASVTSLFFDEQGVTQVQYREPAAHIFAG